MPAREGAPLPAQACGKTEETMDKLRKLNTSRTVIIAILAAIFLLLLYCNYLTPLQGDDYVYRHSFADGSRITSVADILTSLRAHRLTTIRHATMICYLESGRIVESGSHDELIARNGCYRALLSLANRGYECRLQSCGPSH